MLLSAEGKVEVAASGSTTWLTAATNAVLNVGDRIRTGLRSRATLRLSNLSILRLNQLTTLQIQAPANPAAQTGLNLETGAGYFFHRDRPADLEFRTPLASGAIRGTEFHVEVGPGGRTLVTLLDGQVALSGQGGELELSSGEQGDVQAGVPPRKTAALDALNVIQWTLYYPAVLDVDELSWQEAERQPFEDSLRAYRSGDLLAALERLPERVDAGGQSARVYRAALMLAVGQAAASAEILAVLPEDLPLARALRWLILAVRHEQRSGPGPLPGAAATSSEWLAESYYQQAWSNLEAARAAARAAVVRSPGFGFAHARLAELEFSFGEVRSARVALDRGLELAPRHAQGVVLRGFLLSADNAFRAALAAFDAAIQLDGALGNAWLGRGLCRIRLGQGALGRQDLQTAATIEANRSLLRSYLGKAFSELRDGARARAELDRAHQLDPQDPTPLLYRALLSQRENRVHEAIADLERSQELNDNRSVFRSRLLLDQDRAVRAANLASVYRDAGMTEVSTRAASRAVNTDYGNFSAHLFLANSYAALRDPKQINLRYETPWFSELLLANLLAPVGAGSLSQNVSQQEYSRLFDRDHIGVLSSTEYYSSGDWVQSGSQYGTFGGTAYSVDAFYRTDSGQRPNNDLEQMTVSGRIKQQLGPRDSVLLQVQYYESEFGDVAQYYNQDGSLSGALAPSQTLRVREVQEPNLFLGYHHEWAPGHHTLLLVSRLDDTLTQRDTNATALVLTKNAAGAVTGLVGVPFSLDYESALRAYSAELQQIWQVERHTLVGGLRYQGGEVETDTSLARSPTAFPPIFRPLPYVQGYDSDLERFNAYGYYIWRPWEPLQITAGVSYDRLRYPANSEIAPLSPDELESDMVAPKVGLEYTPWKDAALRAAFTRSLGGVFYDQSVRLEPTQVAGFTQAFRSLLPESVAGLVPGSEFESWGLGFDQKFGRGTYLTVTAEVLKSDADRQVGVFEYLPFPAAAAATTERLEFEEDTLSVHINQLLSREWALVSSYRVTHARLTDQFVAVPVGVVAAADRHEEATLHQVRLDALYTHRWGVFAQAGAVWTSQSNAGYVPDLPGDDFWQVNLMLGYRFWQRRAEARLALLNLTDADYRLNPLTLYQELPRERTLAVSLRLNF